MGDDPFGDADGAPQIASAASPFEQQPTDGANPFATNDEFDDVQFDDGETTGVTATDPFGSTSHEQPTATVAEGGDEDEVRVRVRVRVRVSVKGRR